MKFKNGPWRGHNSQSPLQSGPPPPTSSAEWKDVACRGGRHPPARLSPNTRGRRVSISRRCLSAESSVVDGVVLKCPADARSSPTRSLDAEVRAVVGGGGGVGSGNWYVPGWCVNKRKTPYDTHERTRTRSWVDSSQATSAAAGHSFPSITHTLGLMTYGQRY